MKRMIFMLLIFHQCGLLGQAYNDVLISDKKNPDGDNKIFLPGRTFTYHIKSDSSIFLPKELSYTILSPKKSKRTIKNQTEVVISYRPNENNFESTGIVENNYNVWLHPPRSKGFKALEICPFPYVRFPLEKDKRWVEQLSVGDQWSGGMWSGRLLLDIEYKVVGTGVVEIEQGFFDCWIIKGTAISKIGTTSLITFYNESLGFLEMKFATINSSEITLSLAETKDGKTFGTLEQYLLSRKALN